MEYSELVLNLKELSRICEDLKEYRLDALLSVPSDVFEKLCLDKENIGMVEETIGTEKVDVLTTADFCGITVFNKESLSQYEKPLVIVEYEEKEEME